MLVTMVTLQMAVNSDLTSTRSQLLKSLLFTCHLAKKKNKTNTSSFLSTFMYKLKREREEESIIYPHCSSYQMLKWSLKKAGMRHQDKRAFDIL